MYTEASTLVNASLFYSDKLMPCWGKYRGSAKVQVQLGAGSVYPKTFESLFGARRSVRWPARAAKGETVVSTGVKVEVCDPLTCVTFMLKVCNVHTKGV